MPPSSKGVRVMRVEEGSRIVSLVRAPAENSAGVEGTEEASGETPTPETVDVEQVLSGEAFDGTDEEE